MTARPIPITAPPTPTPLSEISGAICATKPIMFCILNSFRVFPEDKYRHFVWEGPVVG
jgi:hypothetical protein